VLTDEILAHYAAVIDADALLARLAA
jgi:hypothetical protein